jgi:hypothetical protein
MFCPHCHEEYAWHVMVCPACDIETVDRLSATPPQPDIALVPVLSTADAGLIALAKSLLEGEEIDYFVRGEGLSDLFGFGRITAFNYVLGEPPAFLVREEDADRARELLADLRSEADGAEPSAR